MFLIPTTYNQQEINIPCLKTLDANSDVHVNGLNMLQMCFFVAFCDFLLHIIVKCSFVRKIQCVKSEVIGL